MGDSSAEKPVRVGSAPESSPPSPGAGVIVTPYFPHGVVVMRPPAGDADAIEFGTSRAAGDALVCGIRPGETMVIGSPEAVATQVAAMNTDRPGTVDISHSRAVISVSGPQAAKALEKVCSLDWSDEMMPNDACGSASVAKISADVIRADDGDQRRYLLICGRSWGQYFQESLLDAAAEFA